MQTAVWNDIPPLRELLAAAAHNRRLAVCLPEKRIPRFEPSEQPDEAERRFLQHWPQQSACLQFAAANILHGLLPQGAELWLMPPAAADCLSDYFSDGLEWQTEARPQSPAAAQKPWFRPSENRNGTPPEHVAVIGAGIAGAATARALAERGVRVSVLEARTAAHAASGNRQGLLYAKISAHDTEQTELLLGGYGHSRRLLDRLLPDGGWQPCGVLHLNYSPAEEKRNRRLAAQDWHAHLYRGVSAAEASELAGIDLSSDGLYWPQGAWLHPPALVRALLAPPNIRLYEGQPLLSAQYCAPYWRLTSPQHTLSADHIVYCAGAADTRPNQPCRRHRLHRPSENRPVGRQLHQPRMGRAALLRREFCAARCLRRLARQRGRTQPAGARQAAPATGGRTDRRADGKRARRRALRQPRPSADRRAGGRLCCHARGVCQAGAR